MSSNLILLLGLATLTIATPILGSLRSLKRQGSTYCPNVTATAINISGDDCPGVETQTNIDAYFGTTATINFGQFIVSSDIGLDRKCTISVDLAYPLPLGPGCLNTGSFVARKQGYNNETADDSASRIYTTSYSDGPGAQYLSDSSSSAFTNQEKDVSGAQNPQSFVDNASTSFTFTDATPADQGGDTPQSLATMSVDLELILNSSTGRMELDSWDLTISTDGASH